MLEQRVIQAQETPLHKYSGKPTLEQWEACRAAVQYRLTNPYSITLTIFVLLSIIDELTVIVNMTVKGKIR